MIIFTEWLKAKGIHDEFFENLIRSTEDLKSYPKTGWVDFAFIWRDTEQGSEFWDNIDTAWQYEIDSTFDDIVFDSPIKFIDIRQIHNY